MQLVILDAHSRKKAEQAAFKAALSEALAERDAEAKALLLGYEKGKKALLRSMAARSADPEEQVRQRGGSSLLVLLGRVALPCSSPRSPVGQMLPSSCPKSVPQCMLRWKVHYAAD